MIEPINGCAEVSIRFEGDEYLVDGLDVWSVEWTRLGQHIVVRHPSYPEQLHDLEVYEVRDGVRRVAIFATGELSNGVWGLTQPV